MVQGGDVGDSEALGRRDDGGVNGAQPEVSVLRDELRDPQPITRTDVLHREESLRQVNQKAQLGIHTQTRREVRHLGDHERGDDEYTLVGLEKVPARGVMLVVGVEKSEQRARVYDDRYGVTSWRRSSSIRSEMSSRPLCPAPADRNRRRPVG